LVSHTEKEDLDYFQRLAIQTEIWEKLTVVNDELVSMAAKYYLSLQKASCLRNRLHLDPLLRRIQLNSSVVRSKHDKGAEELFYEYASLSMVENGRRLCVSLHRPNHASFRRKTGRYEEADTGSPCNARGDQNQSKCSWLTGHSSQ
jgi:hypothetical protein